MSYVAHPDCPIVLAIWNERIAPEVEALGAPRVLQSTNPNSGVARLLTARLTEHGRDAVIDVLTWFASSPHPRAVWLRMGGYGLRPLVRRERFGEFLELARGAVGGAQ